MSGRLFRDEVLAGRRASWLGGISLAQPIRIWALAAGAVAATTLVAGYFFVGEYTQRSRVVGQLVPDRGVSTVVAPTSGVVGRLFAEEGQEVAAGTALVSVDVPRTTASGTDSTAAVRHGFDARRTSLADQRASQGARLTAQVEGHQGQLATARRELQQIEAETRTRRKQVELGRSILARYQRVADRKYVTEIQVDQQRQSVLELVNQQQALERQATLARRNIVQLTQTLNELAAERNTQEASAAWDLAVLDQERVHEEATSGLVVTAPLRGMVANRLVEPGQAVQAGQPLVSLVPDGSVLQAQLLVPSRAIGFIEEGDRVLLRYQAYPYQKFGHHAGRVIRISRSALSPDARATGPSGEPFYRVLVALERQTVTAYGEEERLRPGMVLEADILGEHRRLVEWVLEPLYTLGRKGD
ncbi:MAG TPA: HlyD family efflux transporter periplasmic adaptor subunit [Kofleriaceae bacterium]|nr:HlyD family efflux transporter periplasmic adaptor subunit [Kofleriaceae bacterium]